MLKQDTAMQFQARLKDIASWNYAKPKTYYNWICKPSLGTRVQCPFIGQYHITSQDKPFLLSGTRGELSSVSVQHIGLFYTLADGTPITSAKLKSKLDAQGNLGWMKVRRNFDALCQDERTYKAIQCPNLFQNIKGVVNELLNDTTIPQHGNGDFIVVAVNETTQQVVGQPHIVNGLVFGDIFDMRNWAGALPQDFQPITEPPMPNAVQHRASEGTLLKKIPALIYQCDEIRGKCNNIDIGESSYQLDLSTPNSRTVPVFSVRLLRGQSWNDGSIDILDFSIGPLGAHILCFRHREVKKQAGAITYKATSDWASVEKYLSLSIDAITEGNISNIFTQMITHTASPVVTATDKRKALTKILPDMIKECYSITSKYTDVRLEETAMEQQGTNVPITEYSIILQQGESEENSVIERLWFCTEGVADVQVLFRYTRRQRVLGVVIAELESEWVSLEGYLRQAVTSIQPRDIPSIFDKLIKIPNIKAGNLSISDKLTLVGDAFCSMGFTKAPTKSTMTEQLFDAEHRIIFDGLKAIEDTIRYYEDRNRQVAICLAETVNKNILASCAYGAATSQWVDLEKLLKTTISPRIISHSFGAFVIDRLITFVNDPSPYFAPTHKKDSYTISACKMPVGITFYNPFEDATYTTTEDKCIVLKGTKGEMWTIRKDRFLSTYEMMGQRPITDDMLTQSWLHIKPKSGVAAPTVYAMRIPECTSFQVEAWGATLTCNRPGVPHRGGDMLLCGAKDGKPDLSKFWFVNGEIFYSTYNELPPIDKLSAMFK